MLGSKLVKLGRLISRKPLTRKGDVYCPIHNRAQKDCGCQEKASKKKGLSFRALFSSFSATITRIPATIRDKLGK